MREAILYHTSWGDHYIFLLVIINLIEPNVTALYTFPFVNRSLSLNHVVNLKVIHSTIESMLGPICGHVIGSQIN